MAWDRPIPLVRARTDSLSFSKYTVAYIPRGEGYENLNRGWMCLPVSRQYGQRMPRLHLQWTSLANSISWPSTGSTSVRRTRSRAHSRLSDTARGRPKVPQPQDRTRHGVQAHDLGSAQVAISMVRTGSRRSSQGVSSATACDTFKLPPEHASATFAHTSRSQPATTT